MNPKLGFSLSVQEIGGHRIDYLSFTWLAGGKAHTLEIRASADPDFTAIQLEQMADAIRAAQREVREVAMASATSGGRE